MRINLNYYVTVTLTPEGHVLLNKFRKRQQFFSPEYEWNQYIPDGDKFRCQFWELFDIFGDLHSPEPFLMDVEVDMKS